MIIVLKYNNKPMIVEGTVEHIKGQYQYIEDIEDVYIYGVGEISKTSFPALLPFLESIEGFEEWEERKRMYLKALVFALDDEYDCIPDIMKKETFPFFPDIFSPEQYVLHLLSRATFPYWLEDFIDLEKMKRTCGRELTYTPYGSIAKLHSHRNLYPFENFGVGEDILFW